MITAILAAVLYPEAVEPAIAELNLVCGDRPPALEDIGNLPYCRAYILEVMRWRPVAPAWVSLVLLAADI